MSERRFADAPDETRCRAIVTLSDRTTAQCGRAIVWPKEGLCTQHWTMADRGKPLKLVPVPTPRPAHEEGT